MILWGYYVVRSSRGLQATPGRGLTLIGALYGETARPVLQHRVGRGFQGFASPLRRFSFRPPKPLIQLFNNFERKSPLT